MSKTAKFIAKVRKNGSPPLNMILTERPSFRTAIRYEDSSRGKSEGIPGEYGEAVGLTGRLCTNDLPSAVSFKPQPLIKETLK